MGPYCQFCDNRCFVPRTLRDGRTLILATCPRGMKHDFEKVGEDHRTALNPVTGERDRFALRDLAAEIGAKQSALEALAAEFLVDDEPAWSGRERRYEAATQSVSPSGRDELLTRWGDLQCAQATNPTTELDEEQADA